jgi:dipeptide transport system substrate-binding protein
MIWTARILSAALLSAGLTVAAEAKTLTFCASGSPEGFDPALHTAPATFDASSAAVYDRLVGYDKGTTKPVAALATRWDISEDGLEYTFHLRSGVKFHTTDYFTPSRELNADDVVFSFERQLRKDNAFFNYGGGEWPYLQAMSLPALVKSVQRVDDATVKFTLVRAEASFLADLGMDFASIVSKEYADKLLAAKNRQDLDLKPVGSGPFVFVDYAKDSAIRYKSNPDYWRGKPALDELVFAITPDPAVRLAKLKSGDCQVADPAPGDIAAIKADPDLVLLQGPALDVGYLAYNTQQKPFDDAKVRKALNMAIDRHALVEAVFGGAGMVAKNVLPPTVWSYDDGIADDGYDPDGARKLLDDADAKDLKLKIWAMPVARPYDPDGKKSAEMIKADLAKVGVEATIVTFDWGEYLRRSSAKDRDGAVLLGWIGDNGDPDNFLAQLLSCDAVGTSNRAEWCNQAFQDLIVKAKAATDPAARADLYRQAQAIFKSEAPWATLAHSLTTVALSKKVTGYTLDAFGLHHFDGVDVTP